MNYFITGITGFVGAHLAHLLLHEGHTVDALIRGSNGREMDLLDILTPDELSQISFHYGDLKDYQSLERIFKDKVYNGIFHLAAQSHPPTSFLDTVGTFETNIMGSVNLIDIIQKYQQDCKFMFCSSAGIFGEMEEKTILEPVNPYGCSKLAIDVFIRERFRNGFLKGFVTRAYPHTGPRRGKNFSISWDAYHLALMFAGKKKNRILPVGNLSTKRIVTDVRDVVRAYYMLVQNHVNGEVYSVCRGIEDLKPMRFFTDKLIEISGLKDVWKRISEEIQGEKQRLCVIQLTKMVFCKLLKTQELQKAKLAFLKNRYKTTYLAILQLNCITQVNGNDKEF